MPESTRKAIEKARENGHICMINTGRTQKLVTSITDMVEFDGCLMGCGTMVTYHGEELLHKTFTNELSRRIIDGLRKYKVDAVLEGVENNYLDSFDNMQTEYFKKFALNFKEQNYQSYEEAVGRFDKLYTYVEELTGMEGFQKEFAEELDFIDREQGFYEVIPKGYSKASAMYFLAENLGVPMTDTVAIGDSSNDIPMLECAGTSIAMGNATGIVLEMADYITTDADKDGIWNALTWLKIIE